MATQSFQVRENRKTSASAEVTFELLYGPQYTLIHKDILFNLGIEPYREMIFEVWVEDDMDGLLIKISRKVGEAYFELNGVGAMSPVVFGEEDDMPVIGECTITALGFHLYSASSVLEPLEMNL